MTKVTSLMKKCEKLGLKLEPKPDYPIQLFYSEGVFNAMYEPNYSGIIACEGNTAEKALESLLGELQLRVAAQEAACGGA